MRRPRLAAVTVGFVATAFVVAGCGHRGQALAPAVISQRYQAAINPADTGISAVVQRGLAYVAGSRANLDSSVPSTVTAVRKSVKQLNGISAPQPLHRDILDVSGAMDAVVGDLTALEANKTGDIPPDVASLVADAGRVSAAENVVALALIALTSPTTPPPPTLPTTTTTTVPDTTTIARRSTTTRLRPTTTIARTTTTTEFPASTTAT